MSFLTLTANSQSIKNLYGCFLRLRVFAVEQYF